MANYNTPSISKASIPCFGWQKLPNPSKALFSSKKFCKIFQIPRHIESLDAYMEY